MGLVAPTLAKCKSVFPFVSEIVQALGVLHDKNEKYKAKYARPQRGVLAV